MIKRITVFYIIFSVFFLFLLLSYNKSYSAEVEIASDTYLQFRESTRDDNYLPLYEYFGISIKGIKEGRYSFNSAGWLRYDLRTLRDDKRERDELTYLYLSYEPFEDKSLAFNVGRHLVFGGVASEQIDGISARWEITPSTGISLYGGFPVETEDDGRSSDFVYGGRVFQRIGKKAEFGISYLEEENDNNSYRKEIGADIWACPISRLEIQGQSFYNNLTDGWLEHSYNLRLTPVKELVLTALFSYTDFDDAFSASTLSAFSPDYWGKNEKMRKFGGSIEYKYSNNFSLTADYKNYDYKILNNADYYGGSVLTTLYDIKTGLSLHRMRGYAEKLRYFESRLYAIKSITKLKIALDLINIHYDKAINDLRNAYSISGTLGYKFMKYLTASFNLDYGKNPDYEREIKGLFKIAFNFN